MKETLKRSTTDIFKEINSAKRRLNALQNSVNSVQEVIDKFEQKLRELYIEIDEYQDNVQKFVRREYNDRFDALRRENSELLKIIRRHSFVDSDDTDQEAITVEPAHIVKSKKIASTLSILEKYINLISNNEDSFRLISRAVLIPNIYEKVMQDGAEDYYLYKVPDCIDDLIKEGREFRADIFSKVNTNLKNESAWYQSIEKVDDWWRNYTLPLIYGFDDGEEGKLFSEKPLTLEQALEWNNPKIREEKFFFSHDAMNQMNAYWGEVTEINGVGAIDVKHHTYLQGGEEKPALLLPSETTA